MPLKQSFNLTDKAPYAHSISWTPDQLILQAEANRKDLAALVEQTASAVLSSGKRYQPRAAHSGGSRRLRRHRRKSGPLARNRGFIGIV